MSFVPPRSPPPPFSGTLPSSPKLVVSNEPLPESIKGSPIKAKAFVDYAKETEDEKAVVENIKAELTEAKKGRGGKREGAGRRQGGITTKQLGDAKKRLQELRFDPMEKMIRLYDDTMLKIKLEEAKTKPSAMILISYRTTAQKCLADLLKYGYIVPNDNNSVDKTKQVNFLSITLTDKDTYPQMVKEQQDIVDAEMIDD